MRYRLFILLLLLLPSLCHAQSALYRQYAGRNDLTAVELQGYRIGDTAKVDVVILQADDAAAWRRLCRELDIRTTEGIVSWLAPDGRPARRQAWQGGPCLKAIASHQRRTVCLYRLRSEADYEALAEYQMRLINNE